jgi:hypothetical protein
VVGKAEIVYELRGRAEEIDGDWSRMVVLERGTS